jgi:uncharacterized protein
MISVVLDTNVYISALMFAGEPAEVFSLVLHEQVRLIISPSIAEEIRRVLEQKFKWESEKAERVIARIKSNALLVTPSCRISVIREVDADNRILECAVEGRAHYIISGDKRHILPLVQYEGIKIFSPSMFMQLYRSGGLR